MPIMGMSGTDLKHAAWNFTVAAGVALSCGTLARRVTIFAFPRIMRYFNIQSRSPEANHAGNMAKWMGMAAGMVAASLLQWTISGSRFGLINNPSLEKTLKLGAGQAAIGLVLDLWIQTKRPFFTGFGAGLAAAGHWTSYSLIGFGALGALVGAGKI